MIRTPAATVRTGGRGLAIRAGKVTSAVLPHTGLMLELRARQLAQRRLFLRAVVSHTDAADVAAAVVQVSRRFARKGVSGQQKETTSRLFHLIAGRQIHGLRRAAADCRLFFSFGAGRLTFPADVRLACLCTCGRRRPCEGRESEKTECVTDDRCVRVDVCVVRVSSESRASPSQ